MRLASVETVPTNSGAASLAVDAEEVGAPVDDGGKGGVAVARRPPIPRGESTSSSTRVSAALAAESPHTRSPGGRRRGVLIDSTVVPGRLTRRSPSRRAADVVAVARKAHRRVAIGRRAALSPPRRPQVARGVLLHHSMWRIAVRGRPPRRAGRGEAHRRFSARKGGAAEVDVSRVDGAAKTGDVTGGVSRARSRTVVAQRVGSRASPPQDTAG